MEKRYSFYTIAFTLITVIAVIVIFAGNLLINYQEEKVVREKVETALQVARAVDGIKRSSITEYQPGASLWTKTAIKEISGLDDLLYIRITGKSGKIYQSSVTGEDGKTVTNPNVLKLLSADDITVTDYIFEKEEAKSIIYPGDENKVIWIGLSLQSAKEISAESRIYAILIAIGALLAITLIIFFVFRNSIVIPLNRIIDAFKGAREGDLKTSINIDSKTEIAELTDNFNKMIKDLEYYQLNLEESKDVLEVKIEEKTKELRELNENLENKIQERTEELQSKVDELEKFRRLTVGRELKMKKMKRMIEKMKKIIKKQKKK